MRVKRKNVWTLVFFSVLLLIALSALSGCTAPQNTSDTNLQPPPLQTEQNSQAQQQPAVQSTTNTTTDKAPVEKAVPILENATFELDHYGWSPQEGTIETDDNGNKYIEVRYTWGLFQFLQVKPGETYQIYCKVKQGTGPASPARMSVIFYDKDHKIMKESQSYYFAPGTEWSSFPKNVFKVPEDALFTKLFLLSDGKGNVCFDNISVALSPRQLAPAAGGTAQ